MADRPNPYVQKDPGDIIRSGDWNEMQVRAREDLVAHRHSGGKDGSLIPRAGIEPGAIDSKLIDPEAELSVRALITTGNLSVKGDLTVNGKALLGDIADLMTTVKGLQADKLNRSGDTIDGSLRVLKDLQVEGLAQVLTRFIRKINMATGLGPEDETDNGQIPSRVLTFRKFYDESAIRIIYCDNIRVRGNNTAARWEIKVDGAAPPGGAIYQDKYSICDGGVTIIDRHDPATILGYAVGIPAGVHTIGVWVGPMGTYSCNAYTGWSSSRWTLEAQEVWL